MSHNKELVEKQQLENHLVSCWHTVLENNILLSHQHNRGMRSTLCVCLWHKSLVENNVFVSPDSSPLPTQPLISQWCKAKMVKKKQPNKTTKPPKSSVTSANKTCRNASSLQLICKFWYMARNTSAKKCIWGGSAVVVKGDTRFDGSVRDNKRIFLPYLQPGLTRRGGTEESGSLGLGLWSWARPCQWIFLLLFFFF